jgi:myo-inositol-1-phosphate synthase
MTINVAIAGVGNCANSLIQGLTFYADVADDALVPGLMHTMFGPYRVSDIRVVAAFDVDAAKVGSDLADAMWASENDTHRFADVAPTGVTVQRGPTLDGLGEYYRLVIDESDAPVVDVVAALRAAAVDVLVCYLPVGSEDAAKFYAQAAIDAGVAFVNALPVFIASDPVWAAKFVDAGIPIVGDDVKSQLGATITHRVLARLFEERGLVLDRTYQLNVGGNMDFKNMLERKRLESKKVSKTQAVTSNVSSEWGTDDVHIGPSDHVPWLSDRKVAFVRIEGHGFGNAPTSLEYRLEVWDSPNSAGVVIDAIRAAKLAADRGIGSVPRPDRANPPREFHRWPFPFLIQEVVGLVGLKSSRVITPAPHITPTTNLPEKGKGQRAANHSRRRTSASSAPSGPASSRSSSRNL